MKVWNLGIVASSVALAATAIASGCNTTLVIEGMGGGTTTSTGYGAAYTTSSGFTSTTSSGFTSTTSSSGFTSTTSSSGFTSTTSSSGFSSTTSSSGTIGTGGGGTGGGLAGPPQPGPAGPPGPFGLVTFAVQSILLGDTDPNGAPDQTNGWKNYGYNIDGVSPANLGAFCKPANGASPSVVHQHGNGGIENAFGHLILPIILGISSSASTAANKQIAAGEFTLLTWLNLGSGADQDPVPSQQGPGGALGHAPRWDGTDAWPWLMGRASSTPGYLVANTWVSSNPSAAGGARLALPVGFLGLGGLGSALATVPLNHAVVTMMLDPKHQQATGGIISGVIPTANLVAQIVQTAGTFDPSLCSGPTIDSIVSQIQQASDIGADGLQDPTQTCDGISIGLGFTGALVTLGPPVAPPSQPNPCGDGG